MPNRQRRGRETELRVAEYLRDRLGYTDAVAAPCYGPGADISGVPWSVEVKARRRLDIDAALRQAEHQNGRTPLVIIRPDGAGSDPGMWWAVTRVKHLRPSRADLG